MEHVCLANLEAGLDEIRRSPRDEGRVEIIVRRPQNGEREVLEEGTLSCVDGLVGDNWLTRGSRRTADGAAHPGMQLNLMNVRVAGLVAVDPERRVLAGDQLYVDFDLSLPNLPAGTRAIVGSAVIEFTGQPHRGCVKFSARFGPDALKFVNSPAGVELNLRGVNARVVMPGTVRRGDTIRKL